MLKYLTVPVTPFQQNCSILWCDETHKAAIIDPGGDLDVLLTEVAAWASRWNRSRSPTPTSTMPAAPPNWPRS